MQKTKEYKSTIQMYKRGIPLIRKIRDLVELKYNELFFAVIVHGSVATKEVIAYSDFDGLLIINDSYLETKKLQCFIKESMRLIYNFDPLQHHGWFQIKKSDLQNYPENYLPTSVLRHSKLIYPKVNKLDISFKVLEKTDYKIGFIKILDRFDDRIQNHWQPRNIYELKAMLSQIMLLPSLYYSTINQKGIFKKDSFDEVKKQFSEEEWYPIKIATKIRKEWAYDLNPLQKFLFRITNPTLRKIIVRFFAPKINIKTKSLINNKLYPTLDKFIKKTKTRLK